MKQEEGESLSLRPIADRLPQVLSTHVFFSTIYIFFFPETFSSVLRELAPCMGFGAGHVAAPASLNRGGGCLVLPGSQERSLPPCCEWHDSHRHVVSHSAWQTHRCQRHLGNVPEMPLTAVASAVPPHDELNGLVPACSGRSRGSE